MWFPTSSPTAIAALAFALISLSAGSPSPAPPPEDPECTVTSHSSDNFFDLRPLRRLPDQTPAHHDWIVKGQDYGANFTLNICAPVLHNVTAEGVKAATNISAFYEKDGEVYSIGSTSVKPFFRGRKLVLTYENGSPCPDAPKLRRTTLMSMMCDHEAFHRPSVAFVGQANECAYFFEVRTAAACATVKQQALGPVAVFGVIMGVAAVVYLIGGCMYQRAVMHARGWKQIPHYQVWSAMLGIVWGLIVSAFVWISQHLPGNRRRAGANYTPVGLSGDTFSDDRGNDAENQLIDELDDDWGE